MNHLAVAEKLVVSSSGKAADLAQAEAHIAIVVAQAVTKLAAEFPQLVAEVKALRGDVKSLSESLKTEAPTTTPATRAKKTSS